MKLKRYIAALLAVGLAASLAACAGGGGAPAAGGGTAPAAGAGGGTTADAGAASTRDYIWSIGTADTTGTLYPAGALIASVINEHVEGVRVNVETSAGSPENAVNVQAGIVEMGLATADVSFNAVHGLGAFEGDAKPDLRALGGVFSSISGWMARRDSGITYVSELDGGRLTVGPAASATEIAALIVFDLLNITPASAVNMGHGDAAEEVADRVRDGMHALAGLPVGGQLATAQVHDMVFLSFTDEELEVITGSVPAFHRTIIPAGTYPGQDVDIPTFGVKNLIIVNADMDEQIAFEITEAIFNNIETLVAGHAAFTEMLDRYYMANDIAIELHPGAERFFTEAGLFR